jgi:cyclopropane fatty-acyl-phospholipid synthase-like methyltransferase
MTELTPEQWIDKLAPFDEWNERLLMALFAVWGIQSSMLDIGCGTSAMVNLARKLGMDAIGVDQIAREPDLEHDLRKPFNLGKTYALVMCIEVAEHIPENDSGIFLQNAISHVMRNGRFVFSAAPPAQHGEGHVNLKPAEYWRDRIYDRGLTYREDMTVRLRLAWQWVPIPMQWLIGNLQVFMRE